MEPTLFYVELKHGVTLGIDVNSRDGMTLQVTKVHERGSVFAHNKRCRSNSLQSVVGEIMSPQLRPFRPYQPGQSEIGPGDQILDVNGTRGSAELMMSRLKLDGELSLTLQRHEEITIDVCRAKAKEVRGLSTDICVTPADGMTLQVGDVQAGLVMGPSDRVMKADRIIAVNNVRGDSRKLACEMAETTLPAKLVVRRIRR